MPARLDIETRAQSVEDRDDGAQRNWRRIAPFDAGDGRPAHADTAGDVLLAQTLSNAEGARNHPQPAEVHRTSLASTASRPLCCRLTAASLPLGCGLTRLARRPAIERRALYLAIRPPHGL